MAERYFNLMKNKEFVIELTGMSVKERTDSFLKSVPDAFNLIKDSQLHYKYIRNSIYLER